MLCDSHFMYTLITLWLVTDFLSLRFIFLYFPKIYRILWQLNILFFRIHKCHRNIHSALFWPDWAGAGVKISGKEAPPPPACAASRDNDNDNDRYPHPAGNWLETGNINISRFSSQDPATQLYNSFFGLSAITDAGGMKSRGSDMEAIPDKFSNG